MTARHPVPINLLPKTEFELSFWGRFIKWALSTGRYIIILTELVVIIAFMSRFKLDRDASDVGDAILGKQALLEASSNTEKTLRGVQSKLDWANQKIGGAPKINLILDKTFNANVISLTIKGADVTVVAKTVSETELGNLINRLGEDKTFKTVELADMGTDVDGTIKFTLRLKI
jgi:hypothetical protein